MQRPRREPQLSLFGGAMKRLRPFGIALCSLVSLSVGGLTAQEMNLAPPNLPGLANAFGEIGQNILGDSIFAGSPGPPTAPSLDAWVSDATAVRVHLNIFRISPGPPTTWARLTIEDGVLVLQQDTRIGNSDITPSYGADLSTFTPPNPIVQGQPGPPDFPVGLARALTAVGQNILGPARFFSTKLNPGPPGSSALEIWVADAADVPVNVHLFVGTSPSPPATWLRVTIANGAVVVQQDTTVRRSQLLVDYSADLSAYLPPSPVAPREH
jgi:hypothetical protein